MDFSAILRELNKASLFELSRLNAAIWEQLDDPARNLEIKKRLRAGQEISYFAANENRLVDAVIVQLKRTRALVRNKHDGKLWNILFYHINVDAVDVDIAPVSRQKVDRLSLKVGDKVSFQNRDGVELFGEVTKLNPKTAGVLVGRAQWRVHYQYLSCVIDGELGANVFIEGEVLDREPDS